MSAVIVPPSMGTAPSGRADRRVFCTISALIFAACAAATVLSSASMSDMGEMPMPGGWTMSMLWMRMPDQTWLDTGAAFLGMWTVMMVAMMVPSIAPALWRWMEAFGGSGGGVGAGTALSARSTDRGRLAALIAAGYFSIWIALGVGVFLVGLALAALAMNASEIARAAPITAGVVVLAAGALQFTRWKAHHLVLCRKVCATPRNAAAVLKCGLHLGLHCSLSSAGLTAILLVVGVMDLRVMAAVTAAITIERLAPNGERVARAIGAAALIAGIALVISAV
jgi:predicted metal-binding membrane protein